MDAIAGQTPPGAPTSQSVTSPKVQLFATGLNAHGQLSAGSDGSDLSSFTPMTEPARASHLQLLYANWCRTYLQIDSKILSLGDEDMALPADKQAPPLLDAFGDHNAMLGALDAQGRLWLQADKKLQCVADPDGSPLIGHIAMAGNGKVAITFKQAPNGRLCHILCFDDLEQLRSWYVDPAGAKYDAETQHFMMQGQPRQLLAGTGTFLLRMESGEVYSWGDARYGSLGRGIGEVVAERPGIVEALGGLKVTKLACGGWLNAAVSEDGACYLWGASSPGTEQTLKCLREAGPGELVLVELPSEDGQEPLDVLDVAVGDNHVVLLAEGDRLFAAGENKNGQLGLEHSGPYVEDWTLISMGNNPIKEIICGPKTTYAFLASNS